jgi:hypothetical protein
LIVPSLLVMIFSVTSIFGAWTLTYL